MVGTITPALIAPFGLLLLLIAAMPLTPHRLKRLWELYCPHVAVGLAVIVAAWFVLRIPGGTTLVMHSVREYVSFIVLIGSLFVVAGGIHIQTRAEATPRANVTLLLIGAVLANFIGTTGASMVLIRPFIRMNRDRIAAYHVVFFIFIVSNCGGSLTPIGDPPLFLGYLRGVPFFWLAAQVPLVWVTIIGALLATFYLIDRRDFKRSGLGQGADKRIRKNDTLRVDGAINLLFLSVIIGAVFLPAGYFVREGVMLAAAAGSWLCTPKRVHAQNQFSLGPVREVAFLFVGIFITMMPALAYLEQHGKEFGAMTPRQYYIATGALSAVLDNAPTYVNFLKLAEVNSTAGAPAGESMKRLLENDAPLVVAVSLASVFFGAMTYIGNGPNFMVKSIAESMGVRMPGFFGYIVKFSLPVLLPLLALVGWWFL